MFHDASGVPLISGGRGRLRQSESSAGEGALISAAVTCAFGVHALACPRSAPPGHPKGWTPNGKARTLNPPTMSRPSYLWRKLTPQQCEELMAWRKHNGLPWHRPPHRSSDKTRYHSTAACFEHAPFIGHSRERMETFCGTLLGFSEIAMRSFTPGACCPTTIMH